MSGAVVRARSWGIGALLLLLPLLLAGTCGGGGGGGGTATGRPAIVSFEWDSAGGIAVGDVVPVYLRIDPNGNRLQAYEATVAASAGSGRVGIVSALPAADFDDDGKFFKPPAYALLDGEIRDLVDLRHGQYTTLPVRVAGFLMVGDLPGSTTLRALDVRLVNSNGAELPVTLIDEPVTVAP